MKTAICYCSRHHGNTLKVLQAMAEEGDIDLIDVTTRQAVSLEDYDCVGFASGVYFGKFHEGVTAFARQYLPLGKPVFFRLHIWRGEGKWLQGTDGDRGGKGLTSAQHIWLPGYDTLGPWKLVGGIAMGHPSTRDLHKARAFCRKIQNG